MFLGTSYYHQPQGIGRAFAAKELGGYFNDLTAKANWTGASTTDGIPYNLLSNGRKVHFPIMLTQKALGHWDQWQMCGRVADREEFIRLATWLLNNQDECGGWDAWGIFGQPPQFKYSAMAQGQAISVFARAHKLTSQPHFRDAAGQALVLLRRPVSAGGVCVYDTNNLYLEEFPGHSRDTVLNGWIFALFGLYDYLLQFPGAEILEFYNQASRSLLRTLPDFDAGYWSYYSSVSKRIASPFYHSLHISQLQALGMVLSDFRISDIRQQWVEYRNCRAYRLRALLAKALQKLREPDEVAIVA